MSHLLNGFRVILNSSEIECFKIPCPQPQDVRQLREIHGENWFFIWYGGNAYGIPNVECDPIGSPVSLKLNEHLGARIATSRLSSKIEILFNTSVQVPSKRPYSVLASHNELVSGLLKSAGNFPPIAHEFAIKPKFSFDPRLVEFEEGKLEIVTLLGIRMHWEIFASIIELANAGVNLEGLHVLAKDRQPDRPRLVGRIQKLKDSTVYLSESWDGANSVFASQVVLEPNSASFSRCLSHLLGYKYGKFLKERFVREGDFLTGIGYDDAIQKWSKFLDGKRVQLTDSLACEFGKVIDLEQAGKEVVNHSGAVEHCYDPARTKRHRFAWQGLAEHGPYSRDSLGIRKPRILIVTPASIEGRVDQFLSKFFRGMPRSSPTGFKKGFSETLNLYSPETTKLVVQDSEPSNNPKNAYLRALESHFGENPAPEYELGLVFLRDRDSNLAISENPYFHSKSFLLNHGIPDQQIREATISQPDNSLEYTLRNMAIACYAKIGGTPWTVDHDQTYDDEVVIGMSSVEVSASRFKEKQRYVGITTVFRGDGDYMLANVSKECPYDQYPETLLDAVKVNLEDTKRRNGWQPGDNIKIVFHAYKPLKNLEIEEFMEKAAEAVSGEQNVKFAFVEINETHNFRVISEVRNQISHKTYVPERGTIVRLGRNTRLVSVSGPTQLRRAGSPLPTPLLVHVHEKSTYSDRDYLAEQVLKFTSLSWRSSLSGRLPVTIRYSELIARLLAQLREVPSWSSDVLNTKLKAKKWFL